MTRAELFVAELHERLTRRFGNVSTRNDAAHAALESLVVCGMLTFNGTSVELPHSDPFAELATVHTADEANALLAIGWVLLGHAAHVGAAPDFHLGRPSSVPERVA